MHGLDHSFSPERVIPELAVPREPDGRNRADPVAITTQNQMSLPQAQINRSGAARITGAIGRLRIQNEPYVCLPAPITQLPRVTWTGSGTASAVVVAWGPDRRLHVLDRPVRQCVRAFERDVILDRILVPTGPTPWSQTVHRADTHRSLGDLPRPVLAGQRHFSDVLPAPLRRPFSPYKREAVGSTPTAPTRSEHMWIFKKIDCGLKVVPLVQPEVLDSGRASNTRGILRAPQRAPSAPTPSSTGTA